MLEQQTIYADEIIFNEISCDNVVMTFKWFGTGAAMMKIANELKALIKDLLDVKHIYLLASEMIQTGKLTSVENEGLKQRNPLNDLLHISDSRPVTTIRKAAL